GVGEGCRRSVSLRLRQSGAAGCGGGGIDSAGCRPAVALQAVDEILTPHRSPAPWTLAVLLVVIATKELLARKIERVGTAVGGGGAWRCGGWSAPAGGAWRERSGGAGRRWGAWRCGPTRSTIAAMHWPRQRRPSASRSRWWAERGGPSPTTGRHWQHRRSSAG